MYYILMAGFEGKGKRKNMEDHIYDRDHIDDRPLKIYVESKEESKEEMDMESKAEDEIHVMCNASGTNKCFICIFGHGLEYPDAIITDVPKPNIIVHSMAGKCGCTVSTLSSEEGQNLREVIALSLQSHLMDRAASEESLCEEFQTIFTHYKPTYIKECTQNDSELLVSPLYLTNTTFFPHPQTVYKSISFIDTGNIVEKHGKLMGMGMGKQTKIRRYLNKIVDYRCQIIHPSDTGLKNPEWYSIIKTDALTRGVLLSSKHVISQILEYTGRKGFVRPPIYEEEIFNRLKEKLKSESLTRVDMRYPCYTRLLKDLINNMIDDFKKTGMDTQSIEELRITYIEALITDRMCELSNVSISFICSLLGFDETHIFDTSCRDTVTPISVERQEEIYQLECRYMASVCDYAEKVLPDEAMELTASCKSMKAAPYAREVTPHHDAMEVTPYAREVTPHHDAMDVAGKGGSARKTKKRRQKHRKTKNFRKKRSNKSGFSRKRRLYK